MLMPEMSRAVINHLCSAIMHGEKDMTCIQEQRHIKNQITALDKTESMTNVSEVRMRLCFPLHYKRKR